MFQRLLKVLLTLLLILGLGVTQFYVVGFELHRFYTPSWIFLACAVILLFSAVEKREKGSLWIYSSFLVLMIYVTLRGMNSAVPALTHKEMPVLYYGITTFLVASYVSRSKGALLTLLIFSISLLLLKLCYNLIPASQTESIIKAWGETPNQNGRMYGLFRHYTPFASHCGFWAAALVSLSFLRVKNKGVTLLLKILFLSLCLFTIYGAYKSGSRMGTGVTLLSVVLAGFGCLSLSFLVKNGKVASLNKIALMIGTGVVGLILSGVLFTAAFNKVSEERGRGGDVTEDVMGGMRIASSGMGFSLWQRSPLVGNGPRAYSYTSPSLRKTGSAYDQGGAGHPDAEMTHNDWIQTLAEYGIIGLLLVLLTVGVTFFFLWRTAWGTKGWDPHWFIGPVAATAAISGIMLHSFGDFTMHITPVFMQLLLITGAAYGWASRTPKDAFTKETHRPAMTLKIVLLLVSSALFCWVGQKQIRHAILLVKYDHAKWHRDNGKYPELAREVAQKAPDPFMLRDFGFDLLKQASQTQDKAERNNLFKEAEDILTLGHSLHPFRIEILANLARVKMELGKLEEAETYLSELFKWTGDRWKVHHVGPLAESYLMKKAEALWEKRKSAEAMTYYQKALDYNEKGFWLRGSKKQIELRRGMQKASAERIKNNLKVLEMGKVSPKEGIQFFNGYGL